MQMKYMGSKARYAKEILPIILKNRKPEQWYIEPFAGGMNMIDKVQGNPIESHQTIRKFEHNPEWKRKKCKSCNRIGHDKCIWKKPKSTACSNYEPKIK